MVNRDVRRILLWPASIQKKTFLQLETRMVTRLRLSTKEAAAKWARERGKNSIKSKLFTDFIHKKFLALY